MVERSTSTSKESEKAIIALHGWTGNLTSMKPVANALKIENTTWFFLQGPFAIKEDGYSWFEGNEKTGWKYQESFDLLNKMISNLNEQGFPNQKIFILGFSQGACLAMEYIIRQEFSIGGVIPIAGFIGYKDRFKKDILSKDRNTPVLLIHGNKDRVVLPEESKIAHRLFSEAGFRAELHTLSAGHKVPIQAKKLIESFIANSDE